MDAISFVLGVRTGQLRGAQLKDLIYAFDDRDKEQKGRKAFVRLVYQLANNSEIKFTRAITSAGASEYRIDDSIVTWDVYNAKLKSLGILVKARNFLVFQVRFFASISSFDAICTLAWLLLIIIKIINNIIISCLSGNFLLL